MIIISIKTMLGLSLSYGSSLDVPKHRIKSIYFDRGKIQSGPKVGLHCVSVSRKGFQGLTIDNTVTYLIHLVIRENNSPSPAPIQ